ncbi:MFS transporter [Cellulomonas sp. KRMCY2]|uniref:MFS transporter n=1 Tax=Cellulomonas sp. KRMCY2 TaxID=1304865 RepID=UPI00045E9DFA|nr:MFS transporter [Cellulomonas sp. KRMCY2]
MPAMDPDHRPVPRRHGRVVPNVLLIGLTSMFVDLSTEMVYPLVPIFLTATLGATPMVVGVIEGIAESLASLLKVFSGYLGDVHQHRKRLAFLGYSGAVVYKVLLLAATSWGGVLLARVVDRTGKGIRTAPRDSLIAQSSDQSKLGGSFGLAKMLDMAGSSAGALLALVVVSTGTAFHQAFLWSIVPAVIGILIIPAVREERVERPAGVRPTLRGAPLDARLRLYLGTVFFFCLGNSSNAFLLLKAADLGFSLTQVMLLYLIFNVSASVFAIPSGRFSDRFGRRSVLVPGYLLAGLVYLGLAGFTSRPAVVLLFVVYGACTAFLSGAERAFVAEAAPPHLRGTVLGVYGTLQGIGLLLASLIAGAMWVGLGSDAPFWFGGSLAVLAAAATATILGSGRRRNARHG